MRVLLLVAGVLLAAGRSNAAAAGDFTSAIMVHNGTTSPTLSLATGHTLLAEAAAAVCGYTPAVFAGQRKLVLGYWAAWQAGPLGFHLCNSGPFMQNMWLISCPRALETRDGADAAAEGCWCQLPDPGYWACETGPFGFRATTDTRPGHWYYLVVQANPPDAGDNPIRSFTVTVTPPPPAAADAEPAAPDAETGAEAVAAGANSTSTKPPSQQGEDAGLGEVCGEVAGEVADASMRAAACAATL